MDDEQLARAIIVAAGGEHAADAWVIDLFIAGHEWAQAGIQALGSGVREGVTFPRSMIEEALSRWEPDMGGVIATRLNAALEHAA